MQNKELALPIWQIAQYALMKEASLSPKPGLVDSLNQGAHQDMCLNTFLRSALCLGETMEEFYHLPKKEQRLDDEDTCLFYTRLFAKARLIGLKGEEKMSAITEGVNTHKGAIFTFGLLLISWRLMIDSYPRASSDELLGMWPKTIQELVQDTLPREIEELKNLPAQSHGSQLLQTYGSLGPRGEALAGYPSIFLLALPYYRKISQNTSISEDEAWLRTLLYLMCHLEDSNVLHRAGQMGLSMVQKNSRLILEFDDTKDFYSLLKQFDRQLIDHHISPGGSADLLAATIFVKELLDAKEKN